MALKGRLRDFSLTQLLNLVNLAHKTGGLWLESKHGQAGLFFRDGRLIDARLDHSADNGLLTILQKSGKLTEEQIRTVQPHTAGRNDKELGLVLVNAGYLTQSDVLQAIRKHLLDVVYALFTWQDGKFSFEANVDPPDGRIAVPISLEGVIMEGGRRVQEWEWLQASLPNLDVTLRFAERPGTSLQDIKLSVEEWRVISFINPRNTIRQIARYNNMSEFQIRQIVSGLMKKGLVEVVSMPAAKTPKPAPKLPTKPVKAPIVRKGIILRLIDRIRAL